MGAHLVESPFGRMAWSIWSTVLKNADAIVLKFCLFLSRVTSSTEVNFVLKSSTKWYHTTSTIHRNAFLRDRKTGHTYSFDCEWHEMTDILLRNLRERFTDVNFIGVRVLEPRDANSFIRRYTGWGKNFEIIQKVWKKEKAFAIHQSGYHTYFGISANALSQSTEFSPGEDATKSQIKTAFVKSLRTKKMNKKVLGEFIELIA